MRSRSKGLGLIRIKVTSDVLTRDTLKSTQDFVKNVTKELSEIEWEKMYKNAQKSLKSSLKGGSKDLNRLVKKYKKTDFHKVLTKEVPKQVTYFAEWSSKQIAKVEKVTTRNFTDSKRWVRKKYPKFRKSLMGVYPKVEAFVKDQIPSSSSGFSFKFSR